MVCVVAEIRFELPFVEGLKSRRKIIASIKEKLKKKNISIIDISGEYPKEAALGLSFVGLDEGSIRRKLDSIEELLYANYPEIMFELVSEIV